MWALVLAPRVLKFMERFYITAPAAVSVHTPAEQEESHNLPPTPTTSEPEIRKETANHFAKRDIHVAAGSYFFEAISLILTGIAQSGPQLIFCKFPAIAEHIHIL
jgi:hypothetical protein